MLIYLWHTLRRIFYSTTTFNLSKCYIDDIFFVWDNTAQELDHFIAHLDSIHQTIKFTRTTSTDSITYLDLDIYIKNKTLQTKTRFKSTNTFSYLHGHSNHPSSTFKDVYKGENIYILRNTSEVEIYKKTSQLIKNHFKSRKYRSYLIDSSEIPFTNHDLYIQSTKQPSQHPITFVTTFDQTFSSLKNLLHQDWSRLSSDGDLKLPFQDPPLISYRNSPNLSQLLVRAKLDHVISTNIKIFKKNIYTNHLIYSYPSKNIKCRHQQCGTCGLLAEKAYYSSYQTKQYYPIDQIYCDTTGGIYLLDCKICNKQYIGESLTTIRASIKHHKNMSKSATNRPLYHHILTHKSDFTIYSITIIDQILDTKSRKDKEMYYQPATFVPFGFNVIKNKQNPNPNF